MAKGVNYRREIARYGMKFEICRIPNRKPISLFCLTPWAFLGDFHSEAEATRYADSYASDTRLRQKMGATLTGYTQWP